MGLPRRTPYAGIAWYLFWEMHRGSSQATNSVKCTCHELRSNLANAGGFLTGGSKRAGGADSCPEVVGALMGRRTDSKAMLSLWLGLLVVFSGQAYALAPPLSLRQLNHRLFTVMEGAPNDIVALAQGSDGTLWIGGHTGLTRFDGMRFSPYPGPSDEPLPWT